MGKEHEELSIGVVVGAHGIRGALRVKLFDPDSVSLVVDRLVTLCDADGGRAQRGKVSRVVPQPGTDRVRLWLEGIGDRDAAERLKGVEVRVDRSELPPLEEDEYYLADAVGAVVLRDDEHGDELGRVVGVTTNGVQDLFEVEWQSPGRGARIWLLPALPQFVVEIDRHRVIADLPEGFLPTELDRASAHDEGGGDGA